MKDYYKALQKISAVSTFDRTEFFPYIWRQKEEINSLLNVDYKFWITLDYAILLTLRILKKPKDIAEKEIQEILRPTFDKYNIQIQKIYQKIPSEQYFYIKEEIKQFHHIMSHTLNLIDKRLSHFIPSFLFISIIDNMKILSPASHRTVDPGILARGSYTTLIARQLCIKYNSQLLEIIDFMLWYKEISHLLLPEDRKLMGRELLAKINSLLRQRYSFDVSGEYSIKHLIIELRDVVTSSLINEKLYEIKEEIELNNDGRMLNISKFLSNISSIFLPQSAENYKNNTIVRDLTIAAMILANSLTALQEGDKERLFSHIYLGKTLKGFFSNVTRYLLPPQLALYFNVFLEFIDFLDTSQTSVSPDKQLENVVKGMIKEFQNEIDAMRAKSEITITNESTLLFIDKTRKLRAKGETPY